MCKDIEVKIVVYDDPSQILALKTLLNYRIFEVQNEKELKNSLTIEPDVIIIGKNVELLKKLKKYNTIFFSNSRDEHEILKAVKYGCNAYLFKDSILALIVEVVNKVRQGEKYYSQFVAGVIGSFHQIEENNLTKREVEVLRLIVKGYPAKIIADDLCISTRTVETHRARIKKKLGASNLAELGVIANARKLI